MVQIPHINYYKPAERSELKLLCNVETLCTSILKLTESKWKIISYIHKWKKKVNS